MEWKEQAKQRFSKSADANKWSDIYTSDNPNVEAISFRKRRDFTVNYILNNIAEGADILDLGCGAGPVISQLQTHNYELVGIDYSFDMLNHARRQLKSKTKNIPLLRAECEKVPMADESFDCIICLGVISYAESIDKALFEIYRSLKPGGHAIVSYRNKYNSIFLDPAQLVKYILLLPFNLFKPENKVIGRSISRKEVLNSIKKYPFQIKEEKQIGFGNIRFNGKNISDGRLAIKINSIMDTFFRALNLNYLYRAMADVHIFVLSKPR